MKDGSKGQKEGHRTGANEKGGKVSTAASEARLGKSSRKRRAYDSDEYQKPVGIKDVMGTVGNEED